MKFRGFAAAAALAGVPLPTAVSAQDGLKYADLVHCAATSRVIAEVLGMKGGEATNQRQIDTLHQQTAALMAIAAMGSGKEVALVAADTSKETDTIVAILSDRSKTADFVNASVRSCNTLGQAALDLVNKSKDSK